MSTASTGWDFTLCHNGLVPIRDERTAWRPILRLRAGGNVVNLSTPLGLAVAALGHSTIRRHPRGLFLAEHYRLRFPLAGAFTIGNVIITSKEFAELERRFPRLLQHEERHTWQYLYCFGLPYYLLYGVCMGWSLIRTGDRASANFFERQAGLAWGGYAERPVRPVRDGLRSIIGAARTSVLGSPKP